MSFMHVLKEPPIGSACVAGAYVDVQVVGMQYPPYSSVELASLGKGTLLFFILGYIVLQEDACIIIPSTIYPRR